MRIAVKIILPRKGHQGQAIIKNGCWGDDLAGVVVPQQAEVAEVSVLVVDQGVKHQHAAKLFPKLIAQGIIVVKAGLDAACPYNAANGDKRRVDAGKQPAFGSGNALPIFQVIMHGVQPHNSGDLRGIGFTIWFPPGIGSAACSALVKKDAVALDQPPCFGKHTAGSQLGGGSKRLMAPAHAGVGHQRQYFRKAVLIEVIFLKCPIKALWDNPIAVVQRKALANVDNAFRIVMAQIQCFEYLIHKGAVFRNDPFTEPADDPLAGLFQV